MLGQEYFASLLLSQMDLFSFRIRGSQTCDSNSDWLSSIDQSELNKGNPFKYITRYTEESFATLISLIFIVDGFKVLNRLCRPCQCYISCDTRYRTIKLVI